MATLAQIQGYLQLPQIKAALDTIAWAEGANYNTLYGGGTFSDFSRHPNRLITAGGHTSTAAGRYQFLKGTWDSLGLPEFSPHYQDIGAVMLIARRGGLNDTLNNNFETAVRNGAYGKEWASFPYSPYGQTNRTLAQIMSRYNSRLLAYGGGVTPTVNSSPVNNNDVHNIGDIATVDIYANDNETDNTIYWIGGLVLLGLLL